jgi:hypothetical protein
MEVVAVGSSLRLFLIFELMGPYQSHVVLMKEKTADSSVKVYVQDLKKNCESKGIKESLKNL